MTEQARTGRAAWADDPSRSRSSKFEKIAAMRRESRAAMMQRQVLFCLGPRLEGQPLDEETTAAAEIALKGVREDPMYLVGEGVDKGMLIAFGVHGRESTASIARKEGTDGSAIMDLERVLGRATSKINSRR